MSLLSFFNWFRRRPVYTLTVTPFGVNGWGWHAKAGNGEIVAQGEGYTRREDAERSARSMCAARLVFKEPGE